MEALRRTGGWSLLLSVLPFTVYPLFADAKWLGPFRGTESTLDLAISYHVLSGESLLGIPVQAFADTVIGFLVFGTALMMTGAGKFFINISFAACGTFRGGAAKVCIFASGLLGMMSGSIISNVLTAGTMTIPTMKKTGFRASYAAAIEACASTGAVLAPPVMGATAFVIAQFLNISYAEVAAAAIIPAILYYAGLFMQVDSYAARHNLKGLKRVRAAARVGYDQGRLVLRLRDRAADRHAALFQAREPCAVLCDRAAAGAEPDLFQGHALDVGTINKFFEVNGRTFVELVGILAGCGLLIGAFSMTGVVSSLANDLLRIAGDNAFMLLRHVRDHQPDPRPRSHDHRLLHLPRNPDRAGAGKGRPQQDGRAHVHLLLGHAVVDHAACRHRLVCGCGHRRIAGDEDGMGSRCGSAASSTSSRSSS